MEIMIPLAAAECQHWRQTPVSTAHSCTLLTFCTVYNCFISVICYLFPVICVNWL